MKYELAKKLKDSGFVFRERKEGEQGIAFEGKSAGVVPSLSELIEACGSCLHLWDNEYIKDSWRAQKTLDGEIWQLDNTYATPEEAVANLWLKINTK